MPELIDTSNPDKRNNLSIHMLKFQSKWQQQDNEDPREKFNKKKIRGGERGAITFQLLSSMEIYGKIPFVVKLCPKLYFLANKKTWKKRQICVAIADFF